MTEEEKRPYKSPLENHPEYVHALGMISIENASLESMLGELLGALLGIHLQFGHTLYFTPRAAVARLELLENITEASIGHDEKLKNRVFAIIKRSKAAIGKRNVFIHSMWAENEYPEVEGSDILVARISFPTWEGGDVSLRTLTDLVRDYRALVEEVGPMIDEVQSVRGFGWHVPWPGPSP
jgi:hypothetical protein